MPAPAHIFVPNDGGFEKQLSASEAKSVEAQSDRYVANNDGYFQHRFSELLDQRKMVVPYWPTDKGVMIYGSAAQAKTVSSILDKLEHLVPSAQNENRAVAINNNDNKFHISAKFEQAALKYKVEHVTFAFNNAAEDEKNIRVFAPSRPSIHGRHLVAA